MINYNDSRSLFIINFEITYKFNSVNRRRRFKTKAEQRDAKVDDDGLIRWKGQIYGCGVGQG